MSRNVDTQWLRWLFFWISIRSCLCTRVFVFGSQVKYRLLLTSHMPRKQWFESFLKLLLSLKCSHLSSLLSSAAFKWVRETLNCLFTLAEYNIALLCAWVMVGYEWWNCPNKACKPGFPPQALIVLISSFSANRHIHRSTCNSQATSNCMTVLKNCHKQSVFGLC